MPKEKIQKEKLLIIEYLTEGFCIYGGFYIGIQG